MMNGPIVNSLLRLEGTAGMPPPPFERPNPRFDFFVLKLQNDDDLGAWCERTREVIEEHADYLKSMQADGVSLFLFAETCGSYTVLRFEPAFLQLLVKLGITLEVCCGPDDGS